MNPFFQYGNTLRFEPIIRQKLNRLCQRIDEYRVFRPDGPVAMPMRIVYMSYATDVITSFAFNYCWDHLDSFDFNPWWWQTTQSTAAMTKWTKQFPWLLPVLQSLPDSFVGYLNPSLGLVLKMQNVFIPSLPLVDANKRLETQTYCPGDCGWPR